MNPYIQFPDTLQFEISSICNLKCVGCTRIDSTGEVADTLPKNTVLDLDLFKKIIDNPLVEEHVRKIQFCGTVDEPTSHPQFLDMLRHAVGRYHISIHSNCSVRTPKYWKEMANILKNHSHSLLANIDGLEDTNYIYRRGANWNKIVENITAYLNNGGQGRWQMLIFPWNEHQVEKVKAYAAELGFGSFKSRHNRSELPDFDENWNPIGESDIQEVYEKYVQKHNRDSKEFGHIDCKYQEDETYFISFDGKLWPCCFLSSTRFDSEEKDIRSKKEERYSHYGENWNCLYTHSFDKIIETDFYKNDLVESFSNTNHGTGKCDRIFRCTSTCTQKSRSHNPFNEANVVTGL